MPIFIPAKTKNALGGEALPNCNSRSLRKDRYADPLAKEADRKAWFTKFVQTRFEPHEKASWLPAQAQVVYGRLVTRLLVNLSGGVMENANLNLDRFGLPLIPGSAVKGCARRMALQALYDWIASQKVPGSQERPVAEEACAPCCATFTSPAEMLAAIARVFGWTDDDWKIDKQATDFLWACHGDPDLLGSAKVLLPNFEAFGGTIAFLEARPNTDPGLELDIVTPHHTKYYTGEAGFESAPDTEEPVPVYFPAVAAQKNKQYFSFALIPLKRHQAEDIDFARQCLALGLELFGIGAKTAAGYGVFDTSQEFQNEVQLQISSLERLKLEAKKQEEAAAAEQRKKEEKAKAEAELKAATEGMSEEEILDWKISNLSPNEFQAKLKHFNREPKRGGPKPEEKLAIVRALKGPRLDEWTSFKEKSVKGDLAAVQQAIRKLNKDTYGDKMP